MSISDLNISSKDREILREAAKQQLEYASAPEMERLKDEWLRHNSCIEGRPMVTVELYTFRQDIIPPLLKCEGERARQIESGIYSSFVNHSLFGDDTIVPDYFGIGIPTFFTPFGIDVEVDHPQDSKSIGHHFKEVITDLGEGFHLLKKSTFGVDREAGEKSKAFFEDLLGDILPVRYGGGCLYSVPTQNIVHIMSMENMLFSLYDYPEEFKKMMSMLAQDYNDYFRFLEKERLIFPTNRGEGVGQGSVAYTNELPGYEEFEKRDCSFTSKDIWGFMDSQETTGISPDLFNEFIFPCYKSISENYGLLSYGCCEAVDPIWDKCLSKLDNLRKISISPWCNEEFMGERLAGTKIVYHRKPSPNFLGVGSQLDEPAFREHIRKTVNSTKGCTVEFTQRDVYQLDNTYEKVKRYVEIIREETQK